MSHRDYAYIFEGDGRQMVEAQEEWEMPGQPIPVLRRVAKELGRRFDASGVSNHSEQGCTLWVAIAYAQYKEFSTVLSWDEGVGYSLRKVN